MTGSTFDRRFALGAAAAAIVGALTSTVGPQTSIARTGLPGNAVTGG